MYQQIEGSKVNEMLEVKIFPQRNISDEEVKARTGLTIEQLRLAWIFANRNGFKDALKAWKDTGQLMDYRELQRI